MNEKILKLLWVLYPDMNKSDKNIIIEELKKIPEQKWLNIVNWLLERHKSSEENIEKYKMDLTKHVNWIDELLEKIQAEEILGSLDINN